MYHFVYLTRNCINDKIYIGKHSSNSLDDGYFGKGKRLLLAIKKYGRSNFERIVLCMCLSEEDAYFLESLIVNETFVSRDDTYNLVPGGVGSKYGHLSLKESNLKISNALKGVPLTQERCDNISRALKGSHKIEQSLEHREKISATLKGRAPSEESRNRMRKPKIRPIVTCEYCRRQIDSCIYGKFHGEKCRSK